MHHFSYRNGQLFAEDVAIAEIAREVGTPFYCYSTATLTRHFEVLKKAFAGLDMMICYAMKANSNQAVIKTLADLGAGMDVVSEGELRRALAAGVPAEKIVFSGVGKTVREIDFALDAGIYCFNVESEPELEVLNARALAKGVVAPWDSRGFYLRTGSLEADTGRPRWVGTPRMNSLPKAWADGLDVRLGIAKHLAEVLDDRRFAPPALLQQMVDEGKLGKKSGQGFYDWTS